MPVKALMNLVRRTLPPAERVPDGVRLYAIGDIHGRLDLLDALLASIAADDRARGNGVETRYIFLGDLIDRGPDSRGVVERLLAFSRSGANVRFLVDNAALPADAESYERMVLVFNGDDADSLAAARSAWTDCKSRGFEVTYWQADQRGRWQRRN